MVKSWITQSVNFLPFLKSLLLMCALLYHQSPNPHSAVYIAKLHISLTLAPQQPKLIHLESTN